ncbi:MAG: DUF1622 domain-containing protein [Halanaerobiales bacterium]
MYELIHGLDLFLEYFSEIFMIILEFMGGFVIVAGSLIIFYQYFSPWSSEFSTKLRVKFGRITSLALEFYLGAEILKTVYIRKLSELYVITVIIVLRILMGLVIHLEMGMDFTEFKKEVKRAYSHKDGQNLNN